MTDEHVIAALIGGTLVVDGCGPCNQTSAQFVENPVLHHGHVKKLRALYETPPSRGSSDPSRIEFAGDLAGGARALWHPAREDDDLEQHTPTRPVFDEHGNYTFTAPPEGYDAHERRVVDQIKADHPNKKVEPGEPERFRGPVEFSYEWTSHPLLWPRFAAKVALGLGYEAFGPSWVESHEAWRLRGLFRDARIYEGLTAEASMRLLPQETVHEPRGHGQVEWHELMRPDEHLVAMMGRPGVLTFVLCLFGELYYQLAVRAETPAPPGGRAWLMGAEQRSLVVRPFGTMIGELALRHDTDPGPSRRREHPPSRLGNTEPHPALKAHAWNDGAARGPIRPMPPARPA